jgi:arylsulfatase A-like enzyme
MKSRLIFLSIVCSLLANLAYAGEKPNIVVIMTDNQGYGDLGSYGGGRADTPRIDHLASEGI